MRSLPSVRTADSRWPRLLLLFCGLLVVGCATDSATSADPTTRRVVVAGAGLAGLTAALDLRDAGWDVVVLEARDRVGGRVHTLSAPFAPGLHAESGGESIDDNHDNILALIQRFGLQVEHRPVDKQQGGAVYYQNRRSKMKDFLQSPSGIVSDYTGFSLALLQLGLGLDPEHPEQFQRASMLDQRSLADFLKERHPITEAEFLIRTANQAGFASDLESVSLLFAVQQAVLVADVPDGATETMRVSGGNSKLVEAMASELGSRIRLQAPLTAVEQREGGVRVTAGGQTIDAAYLVLTMPPLPLRRVTFSPPLPAELAAAIAELELGPATKVISEYQHRFWEGAGLSGFTVSEQPFGVSWPATDSYASPQGLLSQFITGSSGLAAAQLDDATRIKQFQAQLDTVYPEGIPERTGRAATVAWSSDPLTGGGYTVYRPGQLLRFFPALRRGTPSIRFAGEHTEALAGYMESAVRSGHRVAHELGSAPPY